MTDQTPKDDDTPRAEPHDEPHDADLPETGQQAHAAGTDDDDAPVAPLDLTSAEYAAIYDDEHKGADASAGDAAQEESAAEDDAPQKGERIAKAMARAGVASRRDAERMILEGRVTVNGAKIDSPALDILPADKVKIDGKPMDDPQETRLWLYYKPVGLVTSESDEKGRQTVFDALPRDLPRVMSVGRLDLNSEGLLLLTNDGELKRRLELPATGWLRRYRVRVNGTPSDLTFDPLRRGAVIEGEEFQPMEIKLDSQQGANAWLTVGLREGKNREIRRAMAHVGLIVNRLIRIGYGPFKLVGMEPNEVREVKRRVLKDQLGGLLTGDPDDKPRVYRARGADDARGPRRDDRGDRAGERASDRGPRPARDGDRPDRKPRSAPRAAAERSGGSPREGGYRDRPPREDGDRKPRFSRDQGGADRKPRFTRDGDAPDRKPRAPRGEGGEGRKPRFGSAGGDKPRGPRSDARSGDLGGGRFDRAERGDRPRGSRDGAPARKLRSEGGYDGDSAAKPAYRAGAGADRSEGAGRGSRPVGKPGPRFGTKPGAGAGQGRASRDETRGGPGKGPRSGPRPGGKPAADRGPGGRSPGGKPPASRGPGGKAPGDRGPGGKGPGGGPRR